MPLPKTFKLSSGHTIPSLGFGTFETTVEANKNAALIGMRLIDTAWGYNREREVGEGLRQSKVPREEFFITTKTAEWHHDPKLVKKSLYDTLERMKIDYVDCLLIHWPIAYKTKPEAFTVDLSTVDQFTGKDKDGNFLYEVDSDGKPVIDEKLSNDHSSTWKAMEELVAEGKIRCLGVSNFSIQQIEALLPHCKEPITISQNEAHPWLQNNELFNYCKSKKILYQAYCPLGAKINLTEDPTIVEIAKKNEMNERAVVISWAIQRGTCPLTRTNHVDRLKANTAVKELSKEDFEKLSSLQSSKRQVKGHAAMHKVWDDLPRSEL